MGPFGFIHADYVEVSHQEKGRAKGLGYVLEERRATMNPRPGSLLSKISEGMPSFVSMAAIYFAATKFVAWRVGGVNAQQTLQPAERVLLNLFGRATDWPMPDIAETWGNSLSLN